MKKILLSALVAGALWSCSIDEKDVETRAESSTDFQTKSEETPSLVPLESTAIFLTKRVEVQEKQTLSVYLVNFAEEELESVYALDGVKIYDDGKIYDEVAGDGIYTSRDLFTPLTANDFEEIDHLFKGEDFKYTDELQQFIDEHNRLEAAKGGKPKTGIVHGKITVKASGGCAVRYTYQGSSGLGITCKYLGCLVFVNCQEALFSWAAEFSIEI